MDKGFCAIPLKACKLPVKFFVNLRGQYLSLQGRVGATISKTTCVEVSANCFRNSFVTRLLIPRKHISQGSMCLLGSLEAKAWVSARRKRAVPPWGTPCTCFVEGWPAESVVVCDSISTTFQTCEWTRRPLKTILQ